MRAEGRRGRAVVPVLGTLVVVVIEFVLLSAVYQRGAPVRDQRVLLAQLSGELRSAAPASTLSNDVRAALAGLRSAGLSRARSDQLLGQASSLGAAPHDTARAAALRETVATMQHALSAEQARIDLEAELSYLALLVVASFGWMVWFRRLVARHRLLQQRITEQDARSDGERRLAALVHNASDVVAVLDADSSVTFTTPSSREVLGVGAERLTGTDWSELVHPDDRALFAQILESTAPGQDQHLSLRMLHADSRVLHVEGSLTNLLADPSVAGLVLTVRDVSVRVDLESQLAHQAFHDALTGLANRRLFGDRLAHALEKRRNAGSSMVVLLCDLDDFKNVNDSLGHGVGDEVLTAIGQRIDQAIRAGDTAARLGGDEFAVLMEDVGIAEAREIAQRIQEAINLPITVNDHLLSIRASIGLAVAVPGEIQGEDALRNADVAMYRAKDNGKSGVAVYEPRVHSEALERLQLRADLQKAIRSDELLLHFQPTVKLASGEIVGFEALVRWLHPSRGLVAPGQFIPMAEQSGLIVPLGSWVLREACFAAVSLLLEAPDARMSVNVAAQQLVQPGFVQEVRRTLADSGLAADRLVLEITESVVLHGLDKVIPKLVALRALGIRIAIDDFGTGYSSLSYLRNLPVDVLKVDKSFIDRVTVDSQDAALTEAIIAMGNRMELITVAEGVEDSGQAAWLSAVDCDYGQGFLWSRPVPLPSARELLTRQGAPAGPAPEAAQPAAATAP